jgi:uncharacterized protein YciI
MLFAVLLEDDPAAAPGIRVRHMAAHLAFLEAHDGQILAAGPLLAEGKAAGGLWLVEAATPEEVERLLREDPFWPTGLRKCCRVLRWKQVFAGGKRLIAPG